MDKLSKMLVRISVIFTATYFVILSVVAIITGISYFNDAYIVVIEGTLCAVCSSQGKFHCKNLRYTCFGIFIYDGLTRLDGAIDFLPVGYLCFIPMLMLVAGMATSIILSINHFRKVRKLKKKKNEYEEYRIKK